MRARFKTKNSLLATLPPPPHSCAIPASPATYSENAVCCIEAGVDDREKVVRDLVEVADGLDCKRVEPVHVPLI